jgi:hypothetical protein
MRPYELIAFLSQFVKTQTTLALPRQDAILQKSVTVLQKNQQKRIKLPTF